MFNVVTADGAYKSTIDNVGYVAIISEADENKEEYTATYGDYVEATSHLFLNFDRLSSILVTEVPDATESEQQSS